ncbi:MAG TPA: carbon monoxide dehydrogenase subunit G [Gammaproteobacteria bacterium]|nr:carbon monoxide dehydrogenase subunit G [Gammaproteobacteria bacterium]
MELKDEIRINAPRAQVYAALNDPDILRQSIPGCESLQKNSDTEFEATVTSKVGPLTAKLKGAVTLSDLDPPAGYTLAGEGKGGPAGFAKVKARVALADEGAATLLRYEVKAEVGGKLGQLGGAIIDRTARKLAGEFFQQFESLVSVPVPAEEAAGAAAAMPARAASAVSTAAVWYFIAAIALALAAWILLT